MNFLTFIFSLLLLLSFGTAVILEKLGSDRRLRSTYLGHLHAEKKFFSKYEAKAYRDLPGTYTLPSDSAPHRAAQQEVQTVRLPPINPECARLNLWPLIQEGREEHSLLYSTAFRLMCLFYREPLFGGQKGAVQKFLDLFLKRVKEASQGQTSLVLEKLFLGSEEVQRVYYQMLKGTKQGMALDHTGYPSLLDVIQVNEIPSKVCLAHAHPDQLAVFFGEKVAIPLFTATHQKKNSPPAGQALIEQICLEVHAPSIDPDIYELVELGRPKGDHQERQKAWVAQDNESGVALRKNVYFRGTSAHGGGPS